MKRRYCITAVTICTIFLLFIFRYINHFPVVSIETVEITAQEKFSSSTIIQQPRITLEDSQYSRTQEALNKINNLTGQNNFEKFLAYKNILDEYSDVLPDYETIYDCLSQEEIYLLQRVAETEVHGSTFDSKCNVVSVILNRFEDSTYNFPGTITEIITQKDQFAYWRTEIEEETILAVEYVWIMGDTTNGALWFDSAADSWARRNREIVFSDEAGHTFYK